MFTRIFLWHSGLIAEFLLHHVLVYILLSGSCGEHSGGQTKKEQILDCQDEVIADKIELSFTSDSDTWLRVYEIKAKGVLLVQGL